MWSILSVLLLAPAAADEPGGCDSGQTVAGFSEEAYEGIAGSEVLLKYQHRQAPNLAFRNISWYLYVTPFNGGVPSSVEAALLSVPVDGPNTLPPNATADMEARFSVPTNLSGDYLVGMRYDVEVSSCGGPWEPANPSQFAYTKFTVLPQRESTAITGTLGVLAALLLAKARPR